MNDISINRSYNNIKNYVDEKLRREILYITDFEGIIIPYFLRPSVGIIGHWVLVFIWFDEKMVYLFNSLKG